MRAEVVAVGTELLLGEIANTNAQVIGRELARIGVDCHVHTAVGDNIERIAESIVVAVGRADAVILTGGIGPTQDDVTREAIALATGDRLVDDPALAVDLRAKFERLGRPMASINLRQAQRPERARSIPNPIGTAPGVLAEHDGKVIYAIPGVPSEMIAMLHASVLPDLAGRAGPAASIVTRVVRVSGMTESGVAEALGPAWERVERSRVTIAFLAGGGEVRVRLTAKAGTEVEANERLDGIESDVRAVLGPAVVGGADETAEMVVARLFADRGWTLACAESVTGGLVAARITDVAGASAFFRGGAVTYATSSKSSVLGVETGIVATHGVVSGPVALAMAAGVRAAFDADVGLATTGVAGPTELDGTPVGTMVVAVSGPRGDAHRELRLPGDRDNVRRLATTVALNLLRLYLLDALER